MGQLNIKDAVLIAEAKELAAMLHTSMTGALRVAVQEKLAATKEARARKVAAIMEIGERASKLVPHGTTSDHSDLYDEMGLPR